MRARERENCHTSYRMSKVKQKNVKIVLYFNSIENLKLTLNYHLIIVPRFFYNGEELFYR